MQRFLLLAYAGLTGSVAMISCTLLALTRLLFEFKGKAGVWGGCTLQGSWPWAWDPRVGEAWG